MGGYIVLTAQEIEELRLQFSWTKFYIERGFGTVFTLGISPALKIVSRVAHTPFCRRRKAVFEGFDINPAPGASWFWWTYAYFRVKKRKKWKRIRLKLTQRQAVRMLITHDNWQGDTGKLVYSGKQMVSWRNEKPSVSTKRVFLSYPRSRQAEAEFVANVLKGQRLDPWYDKTALAPGDDLPGEILEGITSVDCFVPLLCPEYMASKWCRKELELAIHDAEELLIQPIRIESAKFFIPDDVKALLNVQGEIFHANIEGSEGIQQLQEVASSIHEKLGE